MNKAVGYFTFSFGCILALIGLYVLSNRFLWLSSNDIQIKGVNILESVLLPAIAVAAFSYLFIRHGLSLIKSKNPEGNIPPNQNNADEKFM